MSVVFRMDCRVPEAHSGHLSVLNESRQQEGTRRPGKNIRSPVPLVYLSLYDEIWNCSEIKYFKIIK
jgi:hypothetical protein